MDCLLQTSDCRKRASPNTLLGNFREPALHLIDPGAAGLREVQVVTWVPGEPSDHFGCLVRAVIIQYEVNFFCAWRKFGVNQLHELEELLMTMAAVAIANDFASGNVDRKSTR